MTDEDLRTAGITNSNERKVILETFYMCRKQREQAAKETVAPSAPVDEYEPTAPAEEVSGYASSDCVICLDILVYMFLINSFSTKMLYTYFFNKFLNFCVDKSFHIGKSV